MIRVSRHSDDRKWCMLALPSAVVVISINRNVPGGEPNTSRIYRIRLFQEVQWLNLSLESARTYPFQGAQYFLTWD